jgi:hypothetical protein
MLIGLRQDIFALAEERSRRMKGHIYGKDENGGTSTLYVSPVPFELVNATMKKEPGRPDMLPGVKRKMAETDAVGKAVLAAPALGVAAGITGAFKWLSDRKSKMKESEKDG